MDITEYTRNVDCAILNTVFENSLACQYMSGDWRRTLWTLLGTFCILIIRCTETFWSPCIRLFRVRCHVLCMIIWRWPSQNTLGMWTVLYWTWSSRTQFSVSINVWRLAEDTSNITCNFLYCNHQVHRDFLITLYQTVQSPLSRIVYVKTCTLFFRVCGSVHLQSLK